MKKFTHISAMLAIVLVGGFLLASCGPIDTHAASEPEPGAATPEEAARQDLPEFLEVTRPDFANLGFKSEQELAQVTLGQPYQVYNLPLEAVQAYRPGQSFTELLVQVSVFDFPLLVNGEPRGFLGVVQRDGRWEAHSIGGFSSSQHLARWTAQPGNKNQSRKIVLIPALGAKFVLVETPGHERLVPLTGIRGFAEGPDQIILRPYTPEDLIPKLARALAQVQEEEKQPKLRRAQP